MTNRARSVRTQLLGVALACALAVLPGCIVGSPLAAFSGEPYGMVIDDVRAIQGKKTSIWSDAEVFAVFDLPFAAILDTGFLPISLLMWGILTLAGSGDHGDHGHGHSGGEAPHR